MAHLYLADVPNSTKRSTETIYEIKAPLATFDTIDLDDWEEDTAKKSPNKEEVKNDKTERCDKPEKGIEEISEQKCSRSESKQKSEKSSANNKENNKLEIVDNKIIKHLKSDINASVAKELETPTPTEESAQFDNESLNSETENSGHKPEGAPSDLMDPNSSENNASAEEIQTKLKQKGRKHKEKASNVKYEKIESFSDISDYEKSENQSPLPVVKLRSKAYDSDSDSSDSDSGFIRTGFVTTRGAGARHLRAGFSNSAPGLDFVDSDSTPCSSPKVTRPVIPPPLSKEDAAKLSKKKAYEKRLQRLQVTTTPIERPRSTTPINIVALEEYVNISSPEKSPAKGSLEKLKIKLPLDETGRTKSPRRTVKSATWESGDNQVFSFNEELLFTHTKSAILLDEDGNKYQSPKRILVPPTLSPKLSPARSPRSPRRFCQDTHNLPRYVYSPKSLKVNKSEEISKVIAADAVTEQANWAKFDEVPKEIDVFDGEETNNSASIAQTENELDKQGETTDLNASIEIFEDKSKVLDENAKDDNFDNDVDNEEILTVKIDKTGDFTKCDIECHTAERLRNDAESLKNEKGLDKTNEINSIEIRTETDRDKYSKEKRNGTCIISDDDKEQNFDSLC
ncbi:uncharacterized protein LOC128557500 [Mercenaria mercenaria]|uniref:uncharacterized protein LOC128557500 n=1 Tax=Mercenaria mercenaria TaxID=6596 RepID=UPI00234FA293|nr:uncharacterized protein LOC128557500 [Mercenaria mercenaria]XP_053400874.1 uncharacterized protein LOC128557500 [Mercenaria mercenaria]